MRGGLMNFHDFIDNNRQQLVNDINTIGSNLTSIFNMRNESRNTERFYGKISGLTSVTAEISKGKIYLTMTGVEKFRVGYDKDKTIKNVEQNLLPKLSTEVTDFHLGEYERPIVTITFDRLTPSVVKDIMFLVNNSSAELRASSVGRF
jgi:hypothetical protein